MCGGLQALGEWLDDPDGVDGEPHGPLPGLRLLPLATRYAAPKRLRAATLRFGTLAPPWQALSGLAWPGYEIRCGRTAVVPGGATGTAVPIGASAALADGQGEAIGWQSGNVLGIAVHGLFEDAAVLRALFGHRVRTLHDTFDALADFVDDHLGAAALRALTHP